MENKMNFKNQQTVLLVGNDATLSYLLGRFVEQSQCSLVVVPALTSAQEIVEVNLKAIVFLSRQQLEEAQNLLSELTSLETLIIVCSAVGDETRARELGVDHCLFHPITYDRFQTALEVV